MNQVYLKDTRKRSGWFWLDNEVFDMTLDPYSFMVYAYLVRIADRASEVASLSLRKIERALRISRKKIVQALKDLEEKRMIIKKQQKGEKGNYYSNIYILTSKENWHYPEGGSSHKTGVVSDGNHGGLPEHPPIISEKNKNFENQWEDIGKEGSIKNNKNQKNKNNQKSSSPYIETQENPNDGGEEERDFWKEQRKKIKNKEKETGSKRERKENLESSAGGRSEVQSPEEVLEKLKEKWKPLLEGQTFKRLSIPQVLFFLENSALSPEETLEIIKKDDENPKILNPIGTLYTSLPLKSANYRWLLKYEEKVGGNECSIFRSGRRGSIGR